MKESKKDIVMDVTKKIDVLPENKRNYILGVMNGIMISFEQNEEKKKDAVAL